MKATSQIMFGTLVALIGAITLYTPGGWDWLSGLNLFLGGLLIGMGYVLYVIDR
jgi:hypothetical protein